MTTLVTGGGGFLGSALVRRLIDRGDAVRVFARGDYPQLRELGAETHRGDLSRYEDVRRAVEGCDLVFHVGAKAGVWGSYKEYYATNVLGTQNVLQACRQHGVSRLVNTSSPSVVFDGHDQKGCDESTPYPAKYLAHYPRTKAMAEAMVMEASDENLATVSLRPHLIWGPGDTQLVPRVIGRAKAGRLRMVGSGQQRVDAVYVDNAVDAHLAAAERLAPDAACAGKTYFITNDEPMPFAWIMNAILEAGGMSPIQQRVSPGVAFAAGCVMELAYSLLRKKEEPATTRFIARQLATAHWYCIDAAKRDLGYTPSVTMAEGMARLAESLEAEDD